MKDRQTIHANEVSVSWGGGEMSKNKDQNNPTGCRDTSPPVPVPGSDSQNRSVDVVSGVGGQEQHLWE